MDLSQRGQGDGREGQDGTPPAGPPAGAAVGGDDQGAQPTQANIDEMVAAIMQMGINRDDALLVSVFKVIGHR